jgi:diacylglycerol O-acyltransferase
MGLIIPICSYNGTISISPTSAVNLMPDLDNFTRYIRESANELEEASQQKLKEIAVLKKFLEQG